MSYQRLSYEELTQLPAGSKIAYRPEGGSSVEALERALVTMLGGEYPGPSLSVLELRENGWYVFSDDQLPDFVGMGPYSTETLKMDYDSGDWFSLVIEDLVLDEVEDSDEAAA